MIALKRIITMLSLGAAGFFVLQTANLFAERDAVAAQTLKTTEELIVEGSQAMAAGPAGLDALLKKAGESGHKPESIYQIKKALMKFAILTGKLKTIDYLAQGNPALINDPYADGDLPVMIAMETGHRQIVEYLIGNGADLDRTDAKGIAARKLAEFHGMEDLIRGQQARLNQALLQALELRDPYAVSFALEMGANPRAREESGASALMLAAYAGDPVSFDMLLEAAGPQALQDQTGELDVVSAVLGGKGAGDVRNMVDMLEQIRAIGGNDLFTEAHHRLAVELGSPPPVLAFFPEPKPDHVPLPAGLEEFLSIAPKGKVPGPDDWKRLQRFLAEEGVYKSAIDGIPGKGTYAAVYAYFHPLAAEIRRLAITARLRGEEGIYLIHHNDEGDVFFSLWEESIFVVQNANPEFSHTRLFFEYFDSGTQTIRFYENKTDYTQPTKRRSDQGFVISETVTIDQGTPAFGTDDLLEIVPDLAR